MNLGQPKLGTEGGCTDQVIVTSPQGESNHLPSLLFSVFLPMTSQPQIGNLVNAESDMFTEINVKLNYSI